MNETHIWVRCRNGAYYADPCFELGEQGYIYFDRQSQQPTLIRWIPLDGTPPALSHEELILLAFDDDGYVHGSLGPAICEARSPLHGDRDQPASTCTFKLARRIPVPALHNGTERYGSRILGPRIDPPAFDRDADEID